MLATSLQGPSPLSCRRRELRPQRKTPNPAAFAALYSVGRGKAPRRRCGMGNRNGGKRGKCLRPSCRRAGERLPCVCRGKHGWRGRHSSGGLAFVRIQIGPKVMTRDATDSFNVKDSLGWNPLPLGNCLGRHVPKCLCQGRRSASRHFRSFTRIRHALVKAYLSCKCKHFFR